MNEYQIIFDDDTDVIIDAENIDDAWDIAMEYEDEEGKCVRTVRRFE